MLLSLAFDTTMTGSGIPNLWNIYGKIYVTKSHLLQVLTNLSVTWWKAKNMDIKRPVVGGGY